jgi:hypothetical protein
MNLSAPSLSMLVAIDGLTPGLDLREAVLNGKVRWNVNPAKLSHYENGLDHPTPLVRSRITATLSKVYGREFTVEEVFPEVGNGE